PWQYRHHSCDVAAETLGVFAPLVRLWQEHAGARVLPAWSDFEFVAFGRDLEVRTDSWAALEPYDVAIVRGWKILEENASAAHSLLRTDDQWQLFNLLQNDRADIVIYSRFEGYALIDAMGIEGAKALEPPLAKREMYLYLNVNHRKLVSPLAEALRAMKADNTYRTLQEQVLGPYLK
ncbi:MAG: substrate-binding periplasmic protein, partial [Desulfurivibrionaceae bacterium]